MLPVPSGRQARKLSMFPEGETENVREQSQLGGQGEWSWLSFDVKATELLQLSLN